MKKILGLDLGTNSIGGALIEIPDLFDDYGKEGKILWLGTRIIPVGDMLQKFESGGEVITKAANRRQFRGARRLKHRYKLRRTRLIKVFKILGWVSDEFPENFKQEINNNPDFKFDINDFLPFEEKTVKEAEKLLGIKNSKGELTFPQDWIVYYLRKKALTEKISIKELARIIYMMNQRRGFKSNRKDKTIIDDEEKTKKEKYVEILTIDSVEEVESDGSSKKGKIFLVKSGIHQWEVRRFKKPEWEGKQYQFLITKEIKKNGEVKFSYRSPKEDEWEFVKVSLEQDIKNSGLQVGEYFFEHLIRDKNYKIRQRIVDRSLYIKEFEAIFKKQSEFHPDLKDNSKLKVIAEELYKINTAKQNEIISNDLLHLFTKDIIYYQRDLKSQKNTVSGCRYEKLKYIKDGVECLAGRKVAPKSSPEFQEFRIWQDINNLRILQKEKIIDNRTYINVDVTEDSVNNIKKAELFEIFDKNFEVSEKEILKLFKKEGISDSTHRINLFATRKKLYGNKSKYEILKVFEKNNYYRDEIFNDEKKYYQLWHILYSINQEKDVVSALGKEKFSFCFPEKVKLELSKISRLETQYASLSRKAINKLLPLMRSGKYWDENKIDASTKDRIEKILNGVFDVNIDNRTREQILKRDFKSIADFQGLPVWLASYVVYGKHSEPDNERKFNDFTEIDVMRLLPNNSLRNPIVEKVIRETLNVVKDLWRCYGQPDEIHIELSRDLKNNADERKRLFDISSKNFEEKERIKKILYELVTGEFEFDTAPDPESTADIEKFRIYENCSGYSYQDYENSQKEKNSKWKPSENELTRYALWISQKCMSPYTGQPIPLGKLFTDEYELEHIIPRSKLKYDSKENLVICESGVNKEKGDRLAAVFISESPKTFNRNGNNFTILSYDEYVMHCKNIFKGAKLKNLLRFDIPDDFISRQINDTRYITKKIASLLSPVAKNPSGIVFTAGSITNELKNEWGLNSIWKDLIKPRFERLEKITKDKYIFYDEFTENYRLHLPDPKIELKRIDHRHHAIDALVIAATTREHIRYLNSLNAADSVAEIKELKRKLVKEKIREFALPWSDFTKDAKNKLSEIIVTFKSENRIITKPSNKYFKWVLVNGIWEKKLVSQKRNKRWLAVRKSMFKQPQGVIYLKSIKELDILKAVKIQIDRNNGPKDENGKPRDYIYNKVIREQIKMLLDRIGSDEKEIKKFLKKYPLTDIDNKIIEKVDVAQFEEFASKRVVLDKKFTLDKINKIPYSEKSPLARLLREHLREFNNKPESAFSGEGLELLTKKNNGKPIEKVTIYEKKQPDDKFKGRYVETDKGGIVYFVMYENENGERTGFHSLSVHKIIERFIRNEPVAEDISGYKKIMLSPLDLVYVPTSEEINGKKIDWSDRKKISERLYKMVSSSKKQCFFVPHNISKPILDTVELGWNKKSEKSLDDAVIKNVCIKIEVDRLGDIVKVYE